MWSCFALKKLSTSSGESRSSCQCLQEHRWEAPRAISHRGHTGRTRGEHRPPCPCPAFTPKLHMLRKNHRIGLGRTLKIFQNLQEDFPLTQNAPSPVQAGLGHFYFHLLWARSAKASSPSQGRNFSCYLKRTLQGRPGRAAWLTRCETKPSVKMALKSRNGGTKQTQSWCYHMISASTWQEFGSQDTSGLREASRKPRISPE